MEKNKPWVALSLVLFFICLALGFLLVQNSMKKTRGVVMKVNKPFLETTPTIGQDALIKSEVQTAVSMLGAINDKVNNKEMTLEQGKKMGADLLRELRYGKDGEGYFWADTVDGVNVVLYGEKTIEGTNRYEAQANGVFYMKEIIAAGKRPGGGYSDYYYTKLGGKELVKKRSFSLYFGPFDWVVGTGYYLN